MVTHLTDTPVPVVHLHQAPRPALPAVRARWLFAFWMAAGAVIAIAAGLVLGILAALQASIGGDRWTPTVQAHGRLQLFGFLASFIVAVALEFLPRLNSRPMFPARVRVAIPALIATGALLLAAGQAFEETVGWLVVPGGLVFAAGGVGFFVTALGVKSPRPLRVDPQPLYLKAAAAWLAVAALLSLWAMGKSDAGVIPLEYSRSVVEIFLRGFVLLVIMGVGLRAFVGHLALEPLTPRRQVIVWAVVNVSVAAWLMGQGLGPLPEADWLWGMADVGLVTGVVMFTVWLGILAPLRATRGAPRYAVLVPLAWIGVLVYSALLFASATVPAFDNLNLYEEGGIRHVYMLGFVVPLMVAMAHIVLARFGTGRVEWENALTAAFVVLCVAWPLRVIPALLDQASSDVGKWLLATAGVLVMAALSLVAAVCLRTAFLMARAART